MLYKHKITGVIVDFKSNITSENWERVDALPDSCKKPRKKKEGLNHELRNS